MPCFPHGVWLFNNATSPQQKKFNRLWFSFADLLEFARRLDLKSRTDLWCGFYY